MIYKSSCKNIKYIIIFLLLTIGNATAQTTTYYDNFDSIDVSKWTAITPYAWEVTNGMISSTGARSGLIFEKFDDTQYLSEIDLTVNKTIVPNHAAVGFYFYYEDSDNRGTIWVDDDNRGEDYTDSLHVESKGSSFTNTQVYINTSTNTSIELNPTQMHHLKVVRLNKNIYVYYDNRLALTTEFKDNNPKGKVGFDVYESTGYFRNFGIRPIDMKNASGYVNELNLTSTNPTTRIGSYTLRLEGIESGTASFSLSKFGKVVDTTLASEGGMAGLKFENGDEGVNFKLVKAFNGSTGSRTELEEMIYAGTESMSLSINNITILPAYYQGANITVNFSIANPGKIRYNGTPAITISTEGSTGTLNPELDLSAGQSKDFTIVVKASKTPGPYKLTVNLKLDDYTTITKSLDYQVRALNPVVTTLSPNLREENGIRGTVTIGSAYPDALVDWNSTAKIEVFRVLENGKEVVYSKEAPFNSRVFYIDISYNDFYTDSGRYLVTMQAGGMRSDRFFEITGPGGEYKPQARVAIPPTVISNSLYPQLMLLLIGMVAALSVRNHMHPRNWSLPLDYVALGCGASLFAAGMLQSRTEIRTTGMILAGIGFVLLLARENDSRINALFMRGSPIHDFIGLILIFMSASNLILFIPEWSVMLTIGTLIVYYTAINLHGERK